MRLTLVILTKNEIEGVRAVIPKLPRYAVDEILAVDGGSTDGTREYLVSQGIRVLSQSSPGRGEACRMGVEAADGDAVILFSPDGNEDPSDILKFRPLLEDGNDVVIASRMMKGAHNEEDVSIIRLRKWANLVFGFLANIFFNRSRYYVTDTINGYRAITRRAFSDLRIDATGFTIEYQMSMRAMKKRLRIAEFPTHEGQRIGGESGSKSLPTGIRFIRCFWHELFSQRKQSS